MPGPRTRKFGLLIVFIATLLWSTAGLFVRMSDLDTWSILAWRSLFAFLTLGAFWIALNKSKASAISATMSWPGAAAIAIGVISGISYIVALQLTTVANVMTVYAALPFITTAFAFFALGERVTLRFIVAGLVALGGIVVMSGAVVAVKDALGICAAFIMTATFAASLVQAKKYPFLDMTLVTVASSAICALIAFPLVQSGLPQPGQLLACALLGALTTGLANVLVLVAGRLIRSSEAGFLSLLDVVLGPLWVWLAFNEKVGPAVLTGGMIVVTSVTWYLMGDRRRNALPTPAS
jgi:drug/metabolite transporter (DMT)-like permease